MDFVPGGEKIFRGMGGNWFFTESWGANKGFGEAPKSCTRKERESTTNSIANRGQGAIAPCRVKGQRPLWGLGQCPNSSTGDQFQESHQQRRRQRSVPASNFALPQERPPTCSIYNFHIVAPIGATDQHREKKVSLCAGLFHCRGESPLRRRTPKESRGRSESPLEAWQ